MRPRDQLSSLREPLQPNQDSSTLSRVEVGSLSAPPIPARESQAREGYWFATKRRRMIADFRRGLTHGTRVLNGPRGPLMNQLLELLYKSSLSWMLFLALSCFIAVSCFWSVLFWASSCTVEDEDTPIHLLVYSFAALTGLDIQDSIARELRCTFAISLLQFVALLLQGVVFVRAWLIAASDAP